MKRDELLFLLGSEAAFCGNLVIEITFAPSLLRTPLGELPRLIDKGALAFFDEKKDADAFNEVRHRSVRRATKVCFGLGSEFIGKEQAIADALTGETPFDFEIQNLGLLSDSAASSTEVAY